jgi:hypothetical protein
MNLNISEKTTIRKYAAISVLLATLFGTMFAVPQANAAADPRNTEPAFESAVVALVQEPCVDSDGDGDAEGNGAIIGNGAVILGVDCEGQLNVEYRAVPALGLPAGDPSSAGQVGLRDGSGSFSSTEKGCDCEGWGLGISDSGGSGWANNAYGGVNVGGGATFGFESFIGLDGGTTATSVVNVTDSLGNSVRVTHTYAPSPETPNLYLVTVTLENIGGTPISDASLHYTRVMDWDIDPTFFNEFVTHKGTGTTTKLLNSGDDGFRSNDPFSGEDYVIDPATNHTDFDDNGPNDHGSAFEFNMGGLAVGETKTFKTFYGNAPDQAGAEAALAAVGAELYSLGQNNDGGAADDDGSQGPTFIFAFGSVGGTPIFPPTVVGGEIMPISMASLFTAGLFTSAAGWALPAVAAGIGASIAAIIRMRRRKVKARDV